MRTMVAGWFVMLPGAAAACGGATEPTLPAAVIVTPASDTLLPGAERQLSARIVSDAGDTTDAAGVVWSSSNPDIAWVSPDGKVTGVRLGTVTITALVSDAQGRAEVRVQRPFSASAVVVGPQTVCALDLSGGAWCFGNNDTGQLGIGNAGIPQASLTQPVAGGHQFTTIGAGTGFACALDVAGKAWCWGSSGGLGQAGGSSSLPVLADTVRTYQALAVGEQTCGLTAGETWCWGGFSSIGRVRKLFVNQQVFDSIFVGYSGSCGLTANGVATCWHDDQGDYDFYLDSSGPLAQVTLGSAFRCVRFASGTGACEGSNASGQLGDGSTNDAGTPVSLPGSWKMLVAGDNSACGLSPDGTAYCWGGNESGQLGSGDSTASLSPRPVSTTRRFRTISTAAGGDYPPVIHRTCGVTTTDELYCWGAGLPAVPAPVGY
ncbi:MAG TPA: Ig-like domain-containing protein [Gemmatimonadales bacterium]|nr:Ig-like domain-containing protein [Gemmatimonadales bacterium]